MRPKQNAEVDVSGEAVSVLHAAWEKGWSLKMLEQEIRAKGGDPTQLFPEVGKSFVHLSCVRKRKNLTIFLAS